MTETLLDILRRSSVDMYLNYRHINTRLNDTQLDREQFRVRKLAAVLRHFGRSVRYALAGYHAYYPISQNRIGLARDLLLLAPFRLTTRQVFLHLHGSALRTFLQSEPRWMRQATTLMLRSKRTRGIALTERLRGCLAPVVPLERTSVVPNTILPPCKPAPEIDHQQPLKVLFLSTLMPSKGYRELVAAVERVRSAGEDVRLHLSGEPLREEDAAWISDRASQDGIDFSGAISEDRKWKAIDACHVLALPSTVPEGQPLALLEAMSRGRCVLTTAVGGIVDTVGEAGIVLPPAAGPDLERSLADALLRLAREREWVRTTGLAARARFEDCFSHEHFLSSWLAATECSTIGQERVR